jgi:hypothetical protein
MPAYIEAQGKYNWLLEAMKMFEVGCGNFQLDDILYFYESHFLKYMTPLFDLFDELPDMANEMGSHHFESEFDLYFSIGPGGLDFLFSAATTLYQFLRRCSDAEKRQDGLRREDRVQDLCAVLVACLKHLRLKTSRERWDPKVVRKFWKEYQRAILPVCLPSLLPCYTYSTFRSVLACNAKRLVFDHS